MKKLDVLCSLTDDVPPKIKITRNGQFQAQHKTKINVAKLHWIVVFSSFWIILATFLAPNKNFRDFGGPVGAVGPNWADPTSGEAWQKPNNYEWIWLNFWTFVNICHVNMFVFNSWTGSGSAFSVSWASSGSGFLLSWVGLGSFF